MELPSYFPNPDRSRKLINDLLERVRNLDPSAKKRLTELLENDADLPMLDKLERNYRSKVKVTLSKMSDKTAAVELGNTLRSHFNRNLSLQREFLHSRVRDVLNEEDEGVEEIEDSFRMGEDGDGF